MKSSISIIAKGYAINPIPIFPQLKAGLGNVKSYLKSPKLKKFMGKQDILAVTALGRALEGIEYDKTKSGIYMTVSYIPFEKEILKEIAVASSENKTFSIKKFINKAMNQLNPLLTFRCLPNMPIYHTSVNFGITGSSFVTHPSIGEFYQCLARAINDLESGRVETAMVGATADMNNYLAEQRINLDLNEKSELADGAGFIVLELTEKAFNKSRHIYYNLEQFRFSYKDNIMYNQELFNNTVSKVYMGPVSLVTSLNTELPIISHSGQSKKGYVFESVWKSYNAST